MKNRNYLNDLTAWFKQKIDVSQLKEKEILVETYKKTFKTENDLVKGWEKQINEIKEQIKKTPTATLIQTIDSCKETTDSIDTLNKKIFSKVREKIETYSFLDIKDDIMTFEQCMIVPIVEDKAKIIEIMENVEKKLSEGFNIITVSGHTDEQPANGCKTWNPFNGARLVNPIIDNKVIPIIDNNRILSYYRALYVSEMIEKYLLKKQKRKTTDFVICTSAYGDYLPSDIITYSSSKDEQDRNNRRISITFSKRKIQKGSN